MGTHGGGRPEVTQPSSGASDEVEGALDGDDDGSGAAAASQDAAETSADGSSSGSGSGSSSGSGPGSGPGSAAIHVSDKAHVEQLTIHGPVAGRDVVTIAQELTYDVSDLAFNPYRGLASFTYEA